MTFLLSSIFHTILIFSKLYYNVYIFKYLAHEKKQKLNFDKITISDFEMSKVIGGTHPTNANFYIGDDGGAPPDNFLR